MYESGFKGASNYLADLEQADEGNFSTDASKKHNAYSYVYCAFRNAFYSRGKVEEGNMMLWLFYGNHHLVEAENFGEAWSKFLNFHGINLLSGILNTLTKFYREQS